MHINSGANFQTPRMNSVESATRLKTIGTFDLCHVKNSVGICFSTESRKFFNLVLEEPDIVKFVVGVGSREKKIPKSTIKIQNLNENHFNQIKIQSTIKWKYGGFFKKKKMKKTIF